MKRRRPGLSTSAIHGTHSKKSLGDPVATPIYQSSTFLNPVGSADRVLYTRYGNNPNQIAIADRLAQLERTPAAAFLSSGMGATALAHLAVLSPGDHLLSSDWIYGGTRKLFTDELPRLGIAVSFADPLDPASWRRKIRKNTRALFFETPTNPLNRVLR
ncbi:MAG: PLP-dependent transferase, partial [Gemmatimonadales bacterium]